MFFKLRLRNFWILLLVLSSLWVASVFGPLLYSELSPTQDLWAIVHALQGRGVPPPEAAALVKDATEQGGQLVRTVHVAHYAGGSVVLQNNKSHTKSKTEDSFIAWFQKVPKPILLVVRSYKVDGAVQAYEIGSDEATDFLVRAYAPPLLALVASIYLVREPLPFSVTTETRDFGRLNLISPQFMLVSRTLEPPRCDSERALVLLLLVSQMAARREP